MLREQGLRVAAHKSTDPNVNLGVNNRADLASDGRARHHILERHMLAGVTIVDPARPGSTRMSRSEPTRRSSPDHPSRCDDGRRRRDHRPALDRDRLARRRGRASCTPTSSRPTSATRPRSARSPTCARTRRSSRGEGRHLRRDQELAHRRGRQGPHLAYVGDAEIGAGANVGAGAITANYDGRNKHPTKIGKVRGSPSTPPSLPRSPSAMALTLAPVQ